ncbi:TIGR00730 family Rossman fold protein [Aggregatibacter actinomycetemcomitans]|uniref:LOG family protein n=1 Tax=Aggregatibacter actinomycetemcomitans TaxID=714 RepID=UPI00197C738B|nr:TIGR00730 family Rossman fold protein [Aggregatibacter actinomycetemcomitans]MBN6070514.1 TIGR00730 family Rossman fold protein [Aggregatibacter actinomycetemcomitans]
MNIAVYCGAALGNLPSYRLATIQLGEWIAQHRHTLVYGGGKAGLMGVVADTVLSNGGTVIGVIPEFLQARELTHQGCTEIIIVNSMSERKTKMLALADACIALPGGPGTLEEISEVYSWARIGKNPHPCILFNQNGFYEPLRSQYQSMVTAGFLTQSHFDKLLFSIDLIEIERFILDYQVPEIRTYEDV